MAVGESSSILQTAGGASKRPRSPDAAAQVQDEEADEDVKEKPEEPDEVGPGSGSQRQKVSDP